MQTASVVLIRHTESDAILTSALEALAAQEGVKLSVNVLDQQGSEGIAERCSELNNESVTFFPNSVSLMAVSDARNLGLALSVFEKVLFLDADVVPEPVWAARLIETLDDDGVAIVGCRVLPRWRARPPLAVASRIVREQYSLLDLGSQVLPAETIIGGGYGVHRARLGNEAKFNTSLGRTPGTLMGGEETELCRRAVELGFKVIYDGRVYVEHQIQRERLSYRWLLRRFYYGGRSRVAAGGAPTSPTRFTLADWLFLPIFVPAYLMGMRYQRRLLRTSSKS